MDAFSDEQRHLFESTAEVLEISRGELLLRRGEPGGDLFLVRKGRFEAVDNRQNPEVIVAVLPEGTVIGELAFLDGSPRSMDVRAAEKSTVLRWAHHDLRGLLRRESTLASVFYETVAQLASGRLRRVTDSAMSGALTAQTEIGSGVGRAVAEAKALAEMVKSSFLRSDTQLRVDPADPGAREALRDELNSTQRALASLLEAWPESVAREGLSNTLRRELHPYLVRSTLADRCIRRPRGVIATAETLSHVLVGRASGDGRLGELIDEWLLETPTLAGLRQLTRELPKVAAAALPQDRNRRAMLLNAGTGSVIARLGAELPGAPTTLTVIDPSRTALSYLDQDVAPIHDNISVVTRQENLAEFAVGRMRHAYTKQDLIVVHGLFEYMPDRIAVSMLRTCTSLLRTGGQLVCASLSESTDQHFLDRMLRWPTIRRSKEATERLFASVGYRCQGFAQVAAPAVLMTARAPVAPSHAKR